MENRPYVSLIMVISADGISSKKDVLAPPDWNSSEDHKHFETIVKEIGTAIMGNTAFKAINNHFFSAVKAYVLTHDKGLLEQAQVGNTIYVGGDLSSVLHDIYMHGIHKIALVGGSTINTSFLQENLIDDIYLTIEPILLGEGLPLFQQSPIQKQLQLLESTVLNDQGTLLLHYKIQH